MKWTPKAAKKEEQKKVRMVRDEMDVKGNLFMNPLLVQILGGLQKPKFSGKVDDWPQFFKEWQEYVRVLSSMVPGEGIPDVLLLQILKACLDEQTKRELQQKWNKIPK